MSKKLNILLLHGLRNKNSWLSGVADVELMFPKYDKNNNYLVHSGVINLPQILKEFHFDAIIMMSTFIDLITHHGLNGHWIKQYSFLKKSEALKIVFSQDDYWFSDIRDKFYCDYNIDKLYSVCQPETWNELFPDFIKKNGIVSQGYTTYLTEFTKSLVNFDKPHTEREFDVVYRARKIPNAPNIHGWIKGEIGTWFLNAIRNKYVLKTDISTDSKSVIYGDDWYKFIGNSKSILGSNSGSSIRLRNKKIDLGIKKYQNQNPEALTEEIVVSVVPIQDRNKNYTAISPRNLEAALIGTIQILTPGSYSNFLNPKEHYIPIMQDMSNIDEVLLSISDKEYCKKIIENCKKVFLENKLLDFEHLRLELISFIHRNKKSIEINEINDFQKLSGRYKRYFYFAYNIFIFKELIIAYLKTFIPSAVFKQFKLYFLKS
jgi:hypothetical protein